MEPRRTTCPLLGDGRFGQLIAAGKEGKERGWGGEKKRGKKKERGEGKKKGKGGQGREREGRSRGRKWKIGQMLIVCVHGVNQLCSA